MNLDHLKYFIDAAREKNLSRAARANFVTQSAITRAIAKLEEELGVELVLHKQNHFQLTEAGEAVFAESRHVFDSVGRLKAVATGFLKTLSGPLRVGCNQAIASKLLGPLLPGFLASYPEVQPDIRLGNTDQVQRMVEGGDVDFGIVVDDERMSGRFRTRHVYSGEFVVVRPPAIASTVALEHIIVSRTRPGGLSERYGREFERAYRRPFAPKLVVSSWQVILDLAVAGFGCALVPRFLCADDLRTGRLEVWRHKVRPVPFQLCAIVAKSRLLPRNAAALLERFPMR